MARRSAPPEDTDVVLTDTDTVDLDDELEDDDTEEIEEKAKETREKVDLESLDPNTTVSTGIGMPAGLKLLVQKDADAADISVSTYVRNLLAERYSYVIPRLTRTRKAKYNSDEERDAARKASTQKRNELMKMLMSKYREDPSAFDLELNDDATEG